VNVPWFVRGADLLIDVLSAVTDSTLVLRCRLQSATATRLHQLARALAQLHNCRADAATYTLLGTIQTHIYTHIYTE
jgi:hypothetical protein